MAESGVRTRAETARTIGRGIDESEEGSPPRAVGTGSRDAPDEKAAHSNVEGEESRVQRMERDAEEREGSRGGVESGGESDGRRGAKRSEAHIFGCPSNLGRGQEGHVTWARGELRTDLLPTGEPRVSQPFERRRERRFFPQ